MEKTITDEQLRNDKIIKLFDDCGIPVRLIGFKKDKFPAVIYNHKKVLNCYVNTNSLQFKGANPFKIIFKNDFKLTKPLREKIIEWFKTAKHKECYNVRVKNTKLYLSGYNFTAWYDAEPMERYPVFCEVNYKIYFSKNYANKIAKEYSNEKSKLEVV